MKNGLCVNKTHYCFACNQKGFFCETPMGGDYNTCPCCGKYDFLNNNINYPKYIFLLDDEYEDDIRYKYNYCEHCNVLFELGCMHYAGGCTSNVYNAHFIKKWKHKITNIEYEGMPQFDDKHDWFDNANYVEVLEMHCPHNGNKCKEGGHEINWCCSLVILGEPR
jgi:hypothetical protein